MEYKLVRDKVEQFRISVIERAILQTMSKNDERTRAQTIRLLIKNEAKRRDLWNVPDEEQPED